MPRAPPPPPPGYTAKVAGTEVGVTEPEATFSACFGSAFLMWHPSKYAVMLAERMEKHGTHAWLINTGWTGGRCAPPPPACPPLCSLARASPGPSAHCRLGPASCSPLSPASACSSPRLPPGPAGLNSSSLYGPPTRPTLKRSVRPPPARRSYGTGYRFKLRHTRAIVDAIHSGELAKAEYQTLPLFGLQVPKTASNVPTELLYPGERVPLSVLFCVHAAALRD